MESLPKWSLDSIYSGYADSGYREALETIDELIEAFQGAVSDSALFRAEPLRWLHACIDAYNSAKDLYENLESYAYSRFSTATTDADCTRELNVVEEKSLELKKAQIDFRYALRDALQSAPADADSEPVGSVASHPSLSDYRFFIEEELIRADHMMVKEMEAMASELSRCGGDAWSRLHSTVSSTLSETWDEDTGEAKTVVELRALAYHPDRSVRERAYRKELNAWESAEVPIAFALNGVKGFSVILTRHRNYTDALDLAVREARISRKTLEALIEAMTDALPSFRTYLKAKARALSVDSLAFYDIFAPLAKGSRSWSFEEAKHFIVQRFSEFSDEMAGFATKAFDNGWIDALPRKGKVGGAYCTYFPIAKESRILCNYDDSFGAVSTVAHELGHGYHGSVMTELPNALRDYPMTLAETASIFCESIVFNGAIEHAAGDERTSVLETYLQDSTQVIVDILSRYLFENELFKRRSRAELSPQELCEIMLEAQKQTYGDAIDAALLHPYMWAAKPHYYSQDLPFYNFPYAFGQLFGLGLYGKYLETGPDFAVDYRRILEGTGKASANDVTKAVGFDIETAEFWNTGIRVISERIDEFDSLV